VIDEVVKEHAGIVHIQDHLLRPEVMWLCGDFGQMSYVPFVGGVTLRHDSIAGCSRLALLQKGHRVPLDVYAAGIEMYGPDSGIHPCDCPSHQRAEESLSEKLVTSIAQVPLTEGKLLTHGQGTKSAVKVLMNARGVVEERPRERLCTIAEFQGGSADSVTIIRDVRAAKKGSIFMEDRRANVAISRSTGPTGYHTNSTEMDAIRRFIRASKDPTNRAIVQRNIRAARETADVFGLDELMQFIGGELPAGHSALRAGEKFVRKFMNI